MTRNPKILVVDDEPGLLAAIQKIFKRRHYTVITAATGQEALARLAADPHIEVALLDIVLPDLNGFELLNTIKNNPQTQAIKIVMLSAVDQVADKVKALTAGAADYVVKPFEAEEIVARINTQVQLKQAEETLLWQSRLLLGVSQAASYLLTQTDLPAAIRQGLAVLGAVANVDRACIYECPPPPTPPNRWCICALNGGAAPLTPKPTRRTGKPWPGRR